MPPPVYGKEKGNMFCGKLWEEGKKFLYNYGRERRLHP